MTNPCAPNACGSCPLSGMCGDPADLPPEPATCGAVDEVFGVACGLTPGHDPTFIPHLAHDDITFFQWKGEARVPAEAPERDPAEPEPSNL